MNIEEIALRLIESDCNVDIYFGILDKLEKHTTKIQELEKEKAHIEIAYEEDYKEQQQEIERLNNIINEFDSWLKEKKEQMEEFELYKRKETGAFWYSTMGNIETFIEKIKELKGVDKE